MLFLNRIFNANRLKFIGTSWLAVAAQLVRPVITIVTIPAILQHLGTEGLGLWMTTLSMMGLIGFMNSGLSSALVTAIARASSEPATGQTIQHAVSGFAISVICGLAVAIIGLPLAFLVDWHSIMNVSQAYSPNAIQLIFVILVVGLAFGFLANLPRFIMQGNGHSGLAFLSDLSAAIVSAFVLLVAIYFKLSLPILVASWLFSYMMVLGGIGVFYLFRENLNVLKFTKNNLSKLRILSKDFIRFSIYQVSFAFSSSSDLLIVSLFAGPSASAVFGVAQRIFGLPVMIFAAINGVLWPIMAKADATGAKDLLRRLYIWALSALMGFAIITGIIIVTFYDLISHLWLSELIGTDEWLLVGMFTPPKW
jgi:O-antigen/teichoic acid export membrane protein